MLRNSYFDQYKSFIRKKSLIEKDNKLYHQELNNLVYSQRPISSFRIQKLPSKILPIFIDDVMCDNEVNKLLYSSNAQKEIYFYLKQKKSLLNSNINSPRKKKVLSKLGLLMAKRNNLVVMKMLKSKIDNFYNDRNEYMEKLRNKQELFLKCQPMIDNKLKKLYYKPINEIRLKGYQRAFNQCIKRSMSDQNFNLPNIEVNMNDVYSRLFNNSILNPNLLRNKNTKEKLKEKDNKENNSNSNNNSNNNINSNRSNRNYKKIIENKNTKNFRNKNIRIKTNNIYIRNKNYFYISKLPHFNISNIIKSSKGKEFNIRITPKIRQRCWSTLSGGPLSKSNSENNLSDKNEENKTDEIDYKIKRNKNIFNINKSRNKIDINNIILYNTLQLDKNRRGNEIINVKNYRDTDCNTNLHIAVKNNLIKLVKYFLNKKINPNEKNKDGQTPLHLAIKGGNKKIIELLMKNGADINIKDNEGKKPFDYGSKELMFYFKVETVK